jgi:predicted  nucleic acid-binding Zn-ribbon protein
MEQSGLHRGLELRLEALAARIRTLRDKMERAEGLQRIEELAEIDQLERRYKLLQSRLDELNREGKGFRHGLRNELEKLSYDLSGAVEDFIIRIDSGFRTERRRK